MHLCRDQLEDITCVQFAKVCLRVIHQQSNLQQFSQIHQKRQERLAQGAIPKDRRWQTGEHRIKILKSGMRLAAGTHSNDADISDLLDLAYEKDTEVRNWIDAKVAKHSLLNQVVLLRSKRYVCGILASFQIFLNGMRIKYARFISIGCDNICYYWSCINFFALNT